MLNALDRLPWIWVLPVAAWLAVAPITPEPHLVEKLRLLAQGALVRPIDVFGLALPSVPPCLVALHTRTGTTVISAPLPPWAQKMLGGCV